MTRPRSLLEFLRSVPVLSRVPMRWGDMDAFKHLNNCVYFQYQETARIKYFMEMTSKMKVLQQVVDPENAYTFDAEAFHNASGYGPILASTSCRYLFPATYPDIILMGAKTISRDSTQFTLQHMSWSLRHGRVVSEGEGKIVTFNYAIGQRADVHPLLLAGIDSLERKNCEYMLGHFEDIIARKSFED